MTSKKDSISKTFGPGMWYSIHISSLKLGETEFLEWIRIILNSIPCSKCRKHALQYLEENNPSNYKDIYDENGELIGMFQWTWKFHNDVNIRLNEKNKEDRKIYDFHEAYRMYSNDEILCSDNCGN